MQTGPRSVQVRLDIEPDTPHQQVWKTALANLGSYLAAQGITDVQLMRAAERPETSATSGKFRHVIAFTEETDP